MPFTNTTLSTTPLLETTFISDMRIIVNSNVTVLKSKIEDVINNLQIDLVNKYIGTDLPLGKVYTHNLIVSNQMQFKAGTSGAAAVIAELTQTGGYSKFKADNFEFTQTIKATGTSARAAIKTIVVGGTSGSTDLSYPTTNGNPDPGLYVGDSTTPITAGFYGEVNVQKQAITQSYTNPIREIALTRNGSPNYSYGTLVLSRTDPQFILVNLKLADTQQTTAGEPIWLLLQEDFSSTTSRPNIGQSFTIVINRIIESNNSDLAFSKWPKPLSTGDTTGSLSIMPGYVRDASAGANKYKIAYINSAEWDEGAFPSSAPSAVANVASAMTVKTFVRFYNESVQTDTALADSKGACVTLTKLANDTNFANYVVTGGSNYAIVNS